MKLEPVTYFFYCFAFLSQEKVECCSKILVSPWSKTQVTENENESSTNEFCFPYSSHFHIEWRRTCPSVPNENGSCALSFKGASPNRQMRLEAWSTRGPRTFALLLGGKPKGFKCPEMMW